MIQIKKGSQILTVSNSTFKNTFEKLGYKIVDNSKEEAQKASSNEKSKEIDNQEKELIDQEKQNNQIEEDEKVSSDDLKVNIIGENINNFGLEDEEEEIKTNTKVEEKSTLQKALERKNNKSKGK